MIEVSINNENKEFEEGILLSNVLQRQQTQGSDLSFAVALNGEFVPRSQYENTELKNGDALDIVSPVGGG